MYRVLIVKEGRWGSAKPESYEYYIDFVKSSLEAALDPKQKKLFQVDLVETAREAEKELKKAGVKIVIFLSRGMIHIVKEIAQSFPDTRMMIFSGLIPEKEIVWVPKGAITDPRTLADFVDESLP